MTRIVEIIKFIDIIINYFTLQLVRCAAVSVLVMTLILLLRALFKKTTFVKGLLWSMLLLPLFFGRLTAYYESNVLSKISWRWTAFCMSYHMIGRLYFAGIILMTAVTVRSRYKLCRFVKSMDKVCVLGTDVFVCPLKITPFTAGVFIPKIVLPAFMLEEYFEDELENVLLHEKTHIQLKHLFLYMIWDILRILLWVNPLFTVCLKCFKQDMEDICDRVTIQKSGGSGYEYGNLLLKSLELLQDYTASVAGIPFAFAGEDDFLIIKKRMLRVADFKEYKKTAVIGKVLAAAAFTTAVITLAANFSYAVYQNDNDILIFNRTGEKLLIDDSELLRGIISYDDEFVYVDSEKLKAAIDENDIDMQTFTVLFGGYDKLPGYGGGYYCEFLEPEMLDSNIAKVPYVSKKELLVRMFKYM